jgi:hypothetical protein
LQYVLQKRSARSVTELTVRKARQMLAGWAAEQDAAGSRRDEVVQAAIEAGLSKSEVHRLAGMARTTIDRILGALPAMATGPAMTGISAVCVAIARPYALGILGRARHGARLSGTADRQFRTIAVIPGPARHERKSTANAVGWQRPPGFKSPILRCDQQFRPGAPSGGTAGFRFPGPLCGHGRNPAAGLPHRYPRRRGPQPCPESGAARPHHRSAGRDVCRWFASRASFGQVSEGRAPGAAR